VYGKFCLLLQLLNTSVDLKNLLFPFTLLWRASERYGPQIPQHEQGPKMEIPESSHVTGSLIVQV
jgi:hypothetical protein